MSLDQHDLAVAQMLGELKATGEATLRGIADLKATFTNTTRDHEKRLSSLERWKAYLAGISAAVSGLVQFGLHYFHIGGHQ